MAEVLIDIDAVGEVVVEIPARVEADSRGKPILVPVWADRWFDALSRLTGRDIRVALIRDKKRRTSPQNRYLHGVVYVDVLNGMRQQALEAGMEPPFRSKKDVHNWAKWKFLRTVTVLPTGEEEEVPGSTRKLSTKEFTDYVETISSWSAERGIYVRQPGEMAAA